MRGRVYDIRVTDANDNTCVFFSRLDEETMITILRTIVPVSMHFIDVNVILTDDNREE